MFDNIYTTYISIVTLYIYTNNELFPKNTIWFRLTSKSASFETSRISDSKTNEHRSFTIITFTWFYFC